MESIPVTVISVTVKTPRPMAYCIRIGVLFPYGIEINCTARIWVGNFWIYPPVRNTAIGRVSFACCRCRFTPTEQSIALSVPSAELSAVVIPFRRTVIVITESVTRNRIGEGLVCYAIASVIFVEYNLNGFWVIILFHPNITRWLSKAWAYIFIRPSSRRPIRACYTCIVISRIALY